MEMREGGAGDVDACSVLLVDKTSWENRDVREFAKEMSFVKMGETNDSRCDILLRAWAADTEEVQDEEEEEEEKEEEIVVSHEIIDFEECLDADEDELLFGECRGRTEILPQTVTQIIKCNIEAARWSLEGVEKLEDAGVKSLDVELELMAQKRVDASTSSVGEDGLKVEEIQLALSSMVVDLQEISSTKDPTTKRVVHKVGIKFMPKEWWAGDNQCIFVKAQPNAADVLTRQTSVQTTGGVTLGQTPRVQQLGIGQSNASAVVVKQHGWRSELFQETRAAAWVWSVGYWRDGRRFNPSKTDMRRLKCGGNVSAELINKVLAPAVAEDTSLQLHATDVTATWTVDARACHLDSFDFHVEITLHATVFRLVNFLEGCVGWLRSEQAPLYKFLLKGCLSI